MSYRWFTLEPRDRLVVRDSRPLGAGAMRTQRFPLPPTVAGMLRTRLGLDAQGRFDTARTQELLEQVALSGPLLARLDATGTRVIDVLVPSPADVVFFDVDQGPRGFRLSPKPLGRAFPGATSDLDPAIEIPSLEGAPPDGKPSRSAPAFWPIATLLDWLTAPSAEWAPPAGLGPLDIELRVHVALEPLAQTAEDGALFATEGLRFVRKAAGDGGAKGFDRLALLVGWNGPGPLTRGLVPLGGERSTAILEPRDAPGFFQPIDALQSLRAGARARVVLLTPAIFAEGALPKTLAGAPVISACVGRPQIVSGWDFAFAERKGGRVIRGRPKPTRRMVPAGSVFWVEVPSDDWAAETWMSCVSSSDQDRRDGFGLALVGVA